MADLTVWCVCVGDKYNAAYVYALKEMVEQNLTIPYTFKCITDQNLPGIETVLPILPYHSWWSKLNLFAPNIAAGSSIYLDLDVVITGSIDYLAEYTGTFSAPANWAKSGHGGIQSSVMCWPGNWSFPADKIKDQWPSVIDRLHGDQEFLWEVLGEDWQRIPNVGSYKYHVRGNEIPSWMRVCCFHGKPDPHEVTDECLLPFTGTLRSLIKENTANGCAQALSATA